MFQNYMVRKPSSHVLPQRLEPNLEAIGSGKVIRLRSNCFRLSMQEDAVIHEYRMSFVGRRHPGWEPGSMKEERDAVAGVWAQLQESLKHFVVRCPSHGTYQIFSTQRIQTPVEFDPQPGVNLECSRPAVKLDFERVYTAKQVNEGGIGDASVVVQHIVKKAVLGQFQEKVGRRYFNNHDSVDGKATVTIFRGVFAAVHSWTCYAPHLQVDTIYRIMNKKNVIDSICSSLDVERLDYSDPDVRGEFKKWCLGATVVTLYNTRMYRIKAVSFDLHPDSEFWHYDRATKHSSWVSYAKYLQLYYEKNASDISMDQPMLEAYPEKEGEAVYLVPECCSLTGLNDEVRKDKNFVIDAVKQTKIAPPERLATIKEFVQGCISPEPRNAAEKTMQEWRFTLDPTEIDVDARLLEVPDVTFQDKAYAIEDGTFQRWMRNGVQCPINLTNWLLIYPDSDVPVVDIWMRSLRDIATVAFQMQMIPPKIVVCSNQREDLLGVLEQNLDPSTQMVLLLTPQKDARRVYQIFKRATCIQYPCITQVVRSETIRKRQSIAAVLSRIVLQINAKFCGPLWHIDVAVPSTAPLLEDASMVVGIDIFRNSEGETYYGFAASLDPRCTEYFSTSAALKVKRGDFSADLSLRLQLAFRNALLRFSRRNDGLLPGHILVYRASASEAQWPAMIATELGALQEVVSRVDDYDPQITFVAIAKCVGMRVFSHGQAPSRNVDPGAVIDGPELTPSETRSFFLLSHFATRGTTTPTHYTVLHDTADVPLVALQNLTFRLTFLYFNCTCSVKLPAPAQYAKKIASFVGTAVRAQPSERLLGTFFYL